MKRDLRFSSHILLLIIFMNRFSQNIVSISIKPLRFRRIHSKPLVNTVEALKYYESVKQIKSIHVKGSTNTIPIDHPTIVAILERLKYNSKPGNRRDNHKIALSIEGGGMRGCVSAGSSAAITYLGLNDAIDVVYGSSAGSMIGAYFVSRQSTGVEIYYGNLIKHA